MSTTETTFVVLTNAKGTRVHKATCKRLNLGLVPETAYVTGESAVAIPGAKAATCCKPRLPEATPTPVPVERESQGWDAPLGPLPESPEPTHTADNCSGGDEAHDAHMEMNDECPWGAKVERSNDTPPAVPPLTEHRAIVRRASAQRKALAKWVDGGRRGKRPITVDYDRLVAEYRAAGPFGTPTLTTAADAPTTERTPEPITSEAVSATTRRRVTDQAERITIIAGMQAGGVSRGKLASTLRDRGIAASGSWYDLWDDLASRRTEQSAAQ